MSAELLHPGRAPHAPARRREAGWVLAATLVMSSLAIAVTVTYARHAILAKKSLEYGKGASEVEEASRSGLEKVRERMLDGDPPGTVGEGTHDESITPTGEEVIGEREVLPDQRREVRVHATSGPDVTGEEFRTKVRGRVEPEDGPTKDRTTIECDDGQPLLAGSLMVISGPVDFTGVQLSGLMLLEEGAVLTLTDVVLRGTILTRHGVCKSYPQAEGANRPKVRVFGGLRLLAGTELPDTAMSAPDAILETDDLSSIEMRGFVSADQIRIKGRGSMKGMVVSGELEEIDAEVSRPGHGRGVEDYPEPVKPGAEKFVRVAFPNDPVSAATLDLMASAPMDWE
jgi:hypothetical protein